MTSADNQWCILRTSAARTLRLAAALNGQAIAAWTPMRTVSRPAPGQRHRLAMGRRRDMVEVVVPILPGFVFAAAAQLDDVARVGAVPFGPCPGFSILQIGDRVPFIGEASIAGLRAAEAEAEAAIQAERDAAGREALRQQRAEMLRTERAKQKALRAERRDFPVGARVTVDGAAAFAGAEGVVVHGQGTTAVIAFGGSLTMRVEAWRVRPTALCTQPAGNGTAA